MVSCITVSGYTQDLQVNPHKYHLSELLDYEKRIGGEKIDPGSNYIVDKSKAQPVVFKHTDSKLPDLLTYYFSYKKDGKIDYILYEWSENKFDHTKTNNGRPIQESLDFIEKYKSIYQQISSSDGKSEHSGDLNGMAEIATGKYLIHDTWKPDDSTEVELNLTLSNYYKATANFTIEPTYRIRLYVRNQTKQIAEKLPAITQSKLDSAYLTVNSFITNLSEKRIDGAKMYLSDIILKSVTDAQLDAVFQQIKKDKLAVWMSGFQLALDGSQYLMVQYKYISDNNSPPTDIIKVIFDDKGKIVALQPLKVKN